MWIYFYQAQSFKCIFQFAIVVVRVSRQYETSRFVLSSVICSFIIVCFNEFDIDSRCNILWICSVFYKNAVVELVSSRKWLTET